MKIEKILNIKSLAIRGEIIYSMNFSMIKDEYFSYKNVLRILRWIVIHIVTFWGVILNVLKLQLDEEIPI